MSLDTTHVALAGEQQLQQMVGNPDPRISIPAAARLAKMIQERKSQQNQQAMGAAPQPTVKDQLQMAAPQDTGIAMAAGGMVQRNFWGGGVGITNDANTDDMTDADYALQAANTARKQYPGPGQTSSVVDPQTAALITGLVGQSASMQPHTTGIAGSVAAKPANPKAPAPNAPAAGSGLGHAISTDTLESGPVNRTKVDAASRDTGAPEDTHMAAARELIDQLSPLQEKALEQMTASKSAEEARYKAAQAAKHDPNSFVDTMNRIVEITKPFANARVGTRGNFGALLEGSSELARGDKAARVQQAQEEAQHAHALAGIDSGMTAQQIKDLMGNYGIKNSAMTADQSQTIKQQQAELRDAQLVEKRLMDASIIGKNTAAAGKLARVGTGVGGKPMTDKELQYLAAQETAKMVASRKDRPMSEAEMAAYYNSRIAAHRAVTAGKAPVQSGAPAPTTGGAKFLGFEN